MSISEKNEKTRVLHPFTRNLHNWDIPYAAALLGLEPLLEETDIVEESSAEEDVAKFAGMIRQTKADVVMTHDFFPFAALACHNCGIPYIAWIWDSPQVGLFDESIRLPGNYIFDFDRLQLEEIKTLGARWVRHMPLAANLHSIDQLVITEADQSRFACDVSFVGSLYADEGFRLFDLLQGQTSEAVHNIINDSVGKWDGNDHISGILADHSVDELTLYLGKNASERSRMGDRRFIEQALLPRRIANLERVNMLLSIPPRANAQLYTRKDNVNVDLPGIQVNDPVDLQEETPKVYSLSKINLNITLHSIRSGVPRRVFDVLASGGFLLTNYQPELEELFIIGQELDVFHNFDEMQEKIDYYLNHDMERLQITLNGHKKVRSCYTYESAVSKMLKEVSDDQEKLGKKKLI